MKWFQGAGTPKLLLVMAKDGRFQNETCDQNDFGRSEVYILNGQKMILRNDFRIPTPPQKSFPKVGVILNLHGS